MTELALTAGIKKTHDLSGHRIDPGQIGAFVLVIVMAGQGQVFRVIGPAVLPGNDMLHVQAVERLVVLMDPAVFTSMPSPLRTSSRLAASISHAQKPSRASGLSPG
jgi:hypothetical protein